MRTLTQEICAAIFGALLLICLCQSTRSSVSGREGIKNGAKLSLPMLEEGNNDTVSGGVGRMERCFGSFKRWLGFGSKEDEIISGDPNDVRFFLYPNSNERGYYEEVRYGDLQSLKGIHFRVGAPLKIVIHGFTRNYVHEAIQMIKDAYLMRMAQSGTALNVVLVDWEPLANPNVKLGSSLFYRLAVGNVPVVGKRVGEFIQFLMAEGIVTSLKDVHIIGFSLGAHVAGSAGNTLRQLNAGRIPGRVTGLDPAGPKFYERLGGSHRALHKMDARFVDVVHTNMGALGTLKALGHADFYVNGGGPVQYSCELEYEQKQEQASSEGNGTESGGIWDTKLLSVTSCSHNKAPEFFAHSILSPGMIACKCESYREFQSGSCSCNETAVFGEYCDHRARGNYYLNI